ncbi:unnamed protein product [Chrysoparadoxa australica]
MAALSPGTEWQWLMDGGYQFIPYDPHFNATIEAGFAAGSTTVTIYSPSGGRRGDGANYCINFERMEQVNQATGFMRAVRRMVLAAPSQSLPEQWEWQDDNQSWKPYQPSESSHLSSVRSRGFGMTVLHIPVGSRGVVAYEVDVEQFTQTCITTGKVRSIRLAHEAQHTALSGSEAIAAAENATHTVEEDDSCVICFDAFTVTAPALRLQRCTGHFFHAPCIQQSFDLLGPKCPTCQTQYGVVTGTQPDGEMTDRRIRSSCSGYPNYGTIHIVYSFPGGIQGQRHPNPGVPYSGTTRHAFLPDNEEGREVLALFRLAFERRLIFRVGTSITTGRINTTVWGSIPMKTSQDGGEHGYPDGDYFTRVKNALRDKGVG